VIYDSSADFSGGMKQRRKKMLALQAVTTTGGEIMLDEGALESLRASLRGELLCSGDADYEQARQVWNGMIDRRPAVIVRCSGTADVIQAVNFARQQHLLLSVRGGGHNVAGTAVCDGGIMIDLSLMRAVRVDPEERTAHVQGGALWGDVDHETQQFGLAVPGGVVSTTGVAGYTLGGGYGWLRGKYGLTCDCLRSVDLVTADGRLITASQDRNSDLFWGIRGGGGNFGIVTSFEFQLFPVGPQVIFCATIYAAEEAPRLLRAWRDFMAGAPDEFTCETVLWTIPSGPAFPAALWERQILLFEGVYCGDLEAGEKFIQPLRQLGEPLLDLSGRWDYRQLQKGFDWVFPKGEHQNYWKSLYLNTLNDAVIDLMIDNHDKRPSSQTATGLRYHGGAVQRVGATESAFGDRSSQVMISIDSIWSDPQASAANIAWTREFWTALKPYSSGKTYFNFPGLLEEGDELIRTSFGANYERLVALKNKYDPTNLFRLNQNIQPTVQAEHGL